jgi:hypothetical protein
LRLSRKNRQNEFMTVVQDVNAQIVAQSNTLSIPHPERRDAPDRYCLWIASRFAHDLAAQKLGGDHLTEMADRSRLMMRPIAGSFSQYE